MNSSLSKYARYLLWWTGLWILLTVMTQLPECYQRSNAMDAGTPSFIYRDLAEFVMWRALCEVPFGLLWGSLSWWLYLRRFDVQRHLIPPEVLLQKNSFSPFRRLMTSSTPLVALMQGVIFGLPLALLYTGFANFGMGNDDVPSVTINDQNITTEAVGIVMAFILPTLVASSLAGGRRWLRRKEGR